jgi:hypothetical protein
VYLRAFKNDAGAAENVQVRFYDLNSTKINHFQEIS